MRKIIHIDMDCFYAAVEVKFRPELRGKAIGVGGPPGSRSVLLTASYEARKFGVRSAMPSSQAVRLCPQLVFVPPNFERYKVESQSAREIFYRYTSLVEPLSLDEAYLDVSACSQHNGSATLIARAIRAEIEGELGLTASAGVAPNKFLAKIASDWKKPNGQFLIRPQDVAQFMPSLPVEKIYGVGKVTARKMHELGIRTCGDIQNLSLFQLQRNFGSWAATLSDLSRGIDEREVESNSVRKSLTVEETYAEDLDSLEQCRAKIPELFVDWQRRMDKSRLADHIRGLVVKLRFADFKTTTHEISSKQYPKSSHFVELLERAWARRETPVRLIGIGVRLSSDQEVSESPQLSFALK